MSGILPRRIPVSRGVPRDLRRRRLLAARQYAPGSVPRVAIMMGHWDRGEAVTFAGREVAHGNAE